MDDGALAWCLMGPAARSGGSPSGRNRGDRANAGERALTAEKYLVMKMQVRNARTVNLLAASSYAPPDGSQVKLTDEKRNRFAWSYSDAAAEPGTVVAQESAADSNRKWRFRDAPNPWEATV